MDRPQLREGPDQSLCLGNRPSDQRKLRPMNLARAKRWGLKKVQPWFFAHGILILSVFASSSLRSSVGSFWSTDHAPAGELTNTIENQSEVSNPAKRRERSSFYSYFLGAKSRQKRLPAWRRITPLAWPRTPLGAPCFVCLRQTHFRARRRLSLPGGRSLLKNPAWYQPPPPAAMQPPPPKGDNFCPFLY
jgi:hypothetical protein